MVAIQGPSQEGDQSFITLVPLFKDVLSNPPEIFPTEQIYKNYNVPTLQGRLPAMDAFKPQLQLNPGDELDFDRLKYSQDTFDVKPNVVPLMQFQESRIRATIDPMMLDTQMGGFALRWAREMMAVFELQKSYTTDSLTVSDMTAANASGFPRSQNNPKEEIFATINEFVTDKKSIIDMSLWNPVDIVTYESNFYNMGIVPKDVTGYGIINLAGFGGTVKACVSPFAPRGYVYFVDSRSLANG